MPNVNLKKYPEALNDLSTGFRFNMMEAGDKPPRAKLIKQLAFLTNGLSEGHPVRKKSSGAQPERSRASVCIREFVLHLGMTSEYSRTVSARRSSSS
jgi:hypothetical protein